MKAFLFLLFGISIAIQAESFFNSTMSPTAVESCPKEVIQLAPLCQNFSKILESGIDRDILKQAITFKAKNPYLNSPELFVADYGKNSREERLFRINLETGKVTKAPVSHGGGHLKRGPTSKRPRLYGEGVHWGDRDHDGMIDTCKVPEHVTRLWPPSLREKFERENMTRPGFFATKRPRPFYSKRSWVNLEGSSFNGIPMQGLTEEINADAEDEKVALNAPTYNQNPNMGRRLAMGRGSYGPAIKPQDRRIFSNVPVNTIFYSYVPSCPEDMKVVKNQVQGWENMCEADQPQEYHVNCDRVENRNRKGGKFGGEPNPTEGTKENGGAILNR